MKTKEPSQKSSSSQKTYQAEFLKKNLLISELTQKNKDLLTKMKQK